MKNFLGKNKDNKGFTLVELIVVIAIIAIISVIAVPNLLRYVEKARVGTDNNALYEVAHAAEVAFVADKKETRDSEMEIHIDGNGNAQYAPSLSDLVENVSKVIAEEAYTYKSDTFKDRTFKITISEEGIASVDDSDSYFDLLDFLESNNLKEIANGAIQLATGGFSILWGGGLKMTDENWNTLSDYIYQIGQNGKYVEDIVINGSTQDIKDLLSNAGIRW